MQLVMISDDSHFRFVSSGLPLSGCGRIDWKDWKEKITYVRGHGLVYGSPPDLVLGLRLLDNSLV